MSSATQVRDALATTLGDRIAAHHSLYSLPLSDKYLEEMLYNSMKAAGLELEWVPGSHAISADFILAEGASISVKSGKLSYGRSVLTISGSRLTRHVELDDKIAHVKATSADLYLCLSREPGDWENGPGSYHLYVFDSSLLEYPTATGWDEVRKGERLMQWEMETADGLYARIVRSMSDQLWTAIPTDMLPAPIVFAPDSYLP